MEKYNVRFLQTALDDLEEIILYIASDNRKAALEFHDRVMELASRLEDFPQLGVVCPDAKLRKSGYRMLVCGRYLLFYKIFDDEVLIMRVLHGARDYPKLFDGLTPKE